MNHGIGHVTLGLAALACVGACEVSAPARAVDIGEPAPQERATWSSSPAREATAMKLLHLPGRWGVAPGREHEVGMPVRGELVRWLVTPGARVEPGTPLATFVAQELVELSTERDASSARVEVRQRVVDSVRRQVEGGLAGGAALRDAEASLDEARASLRAARKRLAARTGAGVGARSSASTRTWLSSVRGVLTDIRCSPGQVVDAGAICAHVVDATASQLEVAIPERWIARAGGVQAASFMPLGGEPKVPVSWTRSAPGVDPSRGALMTYWVVEEGAQAPLPGASGRVTLEVAAPAGVVAVARAALTTLDGRDHVFVVSSGAPVAVPVEVVGERGEDALVRAAGLSPGDEVVVRGVFGLKSRSLLSEEGS